MIVVTGASGLLGAAILDRFASQNIAVKALYRKTNPVQKENVTWVEADVTDISSLTEILEGATCVIHAAALVSFARRQKEKMYQINVNGTANVVDACLRANVKRLIHVSSIAALGKSTNQNIVDETSSWPGTVKPSNYGRTKYLAELEINRGQAEGLSIAMVNPSVILSSMELNRSSGQIFTYLKNGGLFYPDGHINYVDARDVAEAIFRLYENHSISGRFILNAGTLSWKSFFEKVSLRMGKKAPYIKVPPPVTMLAAGIERIRSLMLGSEPLITKETANLARQYVTYSSKKANSELAMVFREIDETLNWCCKPK